MAPGLDDARHTGSPLTSWGQSGSRSRSKSWSRPGVWRRAVLTSRGPWSLDVILGLLILLAPSMCAGGQADSVVDPTDLSDVTAHPGMLCLISFRDHPLWGLPGMHLTITSGIDPHNDTENNSRPWPSWLRFNESSRTLEGIPSVKDVGNARVTVRSHCPATTVDIPSWCRSKSASFQIDVLPNDWNGRSSPIPGSSSLLEHSECDSETVVASLILCASPNDLSLQRKMALLRAMGDFLSLDALALHLESSPSNRLKAVEIGFQVVSAGPGSDVDCALPDNLELMWPLPCPVVRQLSDLAKVVQHNVDVGRFQEELGASVVGWYVASSNSLLTRQHRRRRAVRGALRTAIPTATLVVPSPTTTTTLQSSQTTTTSGVGASPVTVTATAVPRHVSSLSTTVADDSSPAPASSSSSLVGSASPPKESVGGRRSPVLSSSLTSSFSLLPSSSYPATSGSSTPISTPYLSPGASSSSLSDSPSFSASTLEKATSSSSMALPSAFTSEIELSSTSSGDFCSSCWSPSSHVPSASPVPPLSASSMPDTIMSSTIMGSVSGETLLTVTPLSSSPDLHSIPVAEGSEIHSKSPSHSGGIGEVSESSIDILLKSSIDVLSYSSITILSKSSIDALYQSSIDISSFSDFSSSSPLASKSRQSSVSDFEAGATLTPFLSETSPAARLSTYEPSGSPPTDSSPSPPLSLTPSSTTVASQTEDSRFVSGDQTSLLGPSSQTRAATASSSPSSTPPLESPYPPSASWSLPPPLDSTYDAGVMSSVPSTERGPSSLAVGASSSVQPLPASASDGDGASASASDGDGASDGASSVVSTIDSGGWSSALTWSPSPSSSSMSTLTDVGVSGALSFAESGTATPTTSVMGVSASLAESDSSSLSSSSVIGMTVSPTPTSSLTGDASSSSVLTSTAAESRPTTSPYEPTDSTGIPVSPNSRPLVENPVNLVIGEQGRLLDFTIPRDLFLDVEDGDTRHLALDLHMPNGHRLPTNFWLYLETLPSRPPSQIQRLRGLPLHQDMDNKNVSVKLVATDSGGLTQEDPIVLKINEAPRSRFTHSFTLEMDYDFDLFMDDRRKIFELMDRIASHFNDSSPRFITMLEVRRGSMILTWSNNTLSGSVCQKQAIKHLLNRMVKRDGVLRTSFIRRIGHHLHPMSITSEFLGACVPPPTTTSTTTIATTSDREGNGLSIWAHVILPVLIALVVFILIIFIIFLCNRRRKQRHNALHVEKEAISNERHPIIFPDEVESDDPVLRPKHPVVLPSDPHSPYYQQQQPQQQQPQQRGSQRDRRQGHSSRTPTDQSDCKAQNHSKGRRKQREENAARQRQGDIRPERPAERDPCWENGSRTSPLGSSQSGSPVKSPPPYYQSQSHPPPYRLPPPYLTDQDEARPHDDGENEAARVGPLSSLDTFTTTQV